MSTITRGVPDPQGMRIIRSGVLTFTKGAGEHVTLASVAHNLGYAPIVNAYMRYQLPGQEMSRTSITLPYVQSVGGGPDVGRQNFRVNDLTRSDAYFVYAITDPLTSDTFWYDNEIVVEVTYYFWSRPMVLQ